MSAPPSTRCPPRPPQGVSPALHKVSTPPSTRCQPRPPQGVSPALHNVSAPPSTTCQPRPPHLCDVLQHCHPCQLVLDHTIRFKFVTKLHSSCYMLHLDRQRPKETVEQKKRRAGPCALNGVDSVVRKVRQQRLQLYCTPHHITTPSYTATHATHHYTSNTAHLRRIVLK